MSKPTIKFYLIPFIIFITLIVVIMVISFIKPSKTTPSLPSVRPTLSILSPTPYSLLPTLISPQPFTGADASQELPQDLKDIGEQKTTLRRLTPLTLPFATIEFDYGNDLFLVYLSEPKEESRTQFNSWKEQNYPALTENKFTFN